MLSCLKATWSIKYSDLNTQRIGKHSPSTEHTEIRGSSWAIALRKMRKLRENENGAPMPLLSTSVEDAPERQGELIQPQYRTAAVVCPPNLLFLVLRLIN